MNKNINKNITKYSEYIKEKISHEKVNMEKIKREEGGQGAAEYILLFGGVIVIAIAALMIYRSYFSSSQTNLNASNDVDDIRNIINSS